MFSVAKGQDVLGHDMVFGTEEASARPGDIALDGDSSRPKNGAQQPLLLGPCLVWPQGRSCQQLLSCCGILHARSERQLRVVQTFVATRAVRVLGTALTVIFLSLNRTLYL